MERERNASKESEENQSIELLQRQIGDLEKKWQMEKKLKESVSYAGNEKTTLSI